MRRSVEPSGVEGRIAAPASKSVAQRAIAIAALAHGVSRIDYPGACDDVQAAIGVCRALGAHIEGNGARLMIRGGITPPDSPLDCREAGLSIRMFSAIAATLPQAVTLTGSGSLARRPMGIVEQSLAALGVHCHTNQGYPPITVRGPLPGGQATIDGSLSSQVLTGILIAAPLAQHDVALRVINLQSRPYIDVTIEVMGAFGVEVAHDRHEAFSIRAQQPYLPQHYTVEGDWSGAAFLLVAGAVAGRVTVDNLRADSLQADKAILNALRESGARVTARGTSIAVERAPLRGFRIDAAHCPDLFPPLVALAAHCQGETTITGVSRLRVKESDRAATLQEEFGKLGVAIAIEGEAMRIEGGGVQAARVHAHGDHRIAMATAIAALAGQGPVEIENADAVAKSYPEFFEDLERISRRG